MLASYQIFMTFGVSAVLSFFVSISLLLMFASSRGLLQQSQKLFQPPLLEVQKKPLSSAPELTPLNN
ncbi:unnamed protein product [Leptidea sinapis]|uniref:Uncharacterized protein n=1 Tax=Leptidea sinapis TaxID=189913 RepID=A0A5E4Q866_9NEOP|nr:unnamed protein product [Leptidea sinapis]